MVTRNSARGTARTAAAVFTRVADQTLAPNGHDVPVDHQHRPVEVDITPAHRQRLTGPAAGRHQEAEQVQQIAGHRPLIGIDLGQQVGPLVRGQRAHRPLQDALAAFQTPHVPGRVGPQSAMSARRAHRAGEHRADVAPRGDRQPPELQTSHEAVQPPNRDLPQPQLAQHRPDQRFVPLPVVAGRAVGSLPRDVGQPDLGRVPEPRGPRQATSRATPGVATFDQLVARRL
jgi:hypothetical protein